MKKTDDGIDSRERLEESGSARPYSKPQIIEWGSIVELTGNFRNGAVDPMFGVGGSAVGFRQPLPPK